MSDLIRFHDWLIDRDEIEVVEIKSDDGINHQNQAYDDIKHSVVVKLKDEIKLQLVCDSLYEARKELDYLTARTEAELSGPIYNTYMIKQISFCRDSLATLTSEIKKMMKSYQKIKQKEPKNA